MRSVLLEELSDVDEKHLSNDELSILNAVKRLRRYENRIYDLIGHRPFELDPVFGLGRYISSEFNLHSSTSTEEFQKILKRELVGQKRSGYGPHDPTDFTFEKFADALNAHIDRALELENVDEPEPEAPSSAPFGKWALPAQIGKPYLLKFDLDTDEEKKLIKALEGHFYHDPMGKEQIDLIKMCMKNGWYRSTFLEPDTDRAYRGLKLTFDSFEKLFGFVPGESGNKQLFATIRTNKRGFTWSWSDNAKTAWGFTEAFGNVPADVRVVVSCKLSNNHGKFLDGRVFTSLSEMYIRSELIAIDDEVSIDRIEWRLFD